VKPALIISDRDNVATALEALEPGRAIEVNRHSVVIREPIPSGHKVALADLSVGDAVIKYGSTIGLATAPIARGTHVHTHNLSSSRGRGDLERPRPQPQPGVRLAEPADEPNGIGRTEPVGGVHE
jgi:hypothetical protein